jgi:hypothetical protein
LASNRRVVHARVSDASADRCAIARTASASTPYRTRISTNGNQNSMTSIVNCRNKTRRVPLVEDSIATWFQRRCRLCQDVRSARRSRRCSCLRQSRTNTTTRRSPVVQLRINKKHLQLNTAQCFCAHLWTVRVEDLLARLERQSAGPPADRVRLSHPYVVVDGAIPMVRHIDHRNYCAACGITIKRTAGSKKIRSRGYSMYRRICRCSR